MNESAGDRDAPLNRLSPDEENHHDEVVLRLRITGHLVRLEHDINRLLRAFPDLERPLRVQLVHLAKCAAPAAELLVAPLIDGR